MTLVLRQGTFYFQEGGGWGERECAVIFLTKKDACSSS
jgi:hypothetical protein